MEIVRLGPIIDLLNPTNYRNFKHIYNGKLLEIDTDFVPKKYDLIGYTNGSFYYESDSMHIIGYNHIAWSKEQSDKNNVYMFESYQHTKSHQYTTVFSDSNDSFYILLGTDELNMKAFKVPMNKTLKIPAGIFHSAPIVFLEKCETFSYYTSTDSGSITRKPIDMYTCNYAALHQKLLLF